MIKKKKLSPEKGEITNFFTEDVTVWKDAQKAIKAKGADEIFVSADGRIIGLPKNLGKSVTHFCEQVITGDPEVYLSKEQRRYLKDEEGDKKKHKKKRAIGIGCETPGVDAKGNTVMTPRLSGAFGLLMAIHDDHNDGGVGIFTTSELREKLEAIIGREVAPRIEGSESYLCGEWTRSIGTMERHSLVERTKRGEKTKLGRDGCQDTYELTKDGEIFIKALVRYRGEEVRKYYRRDIQEEYFGGVEKMKDSEIKSVAKKRRRLK